MVMRSKERAIPAFSAGNPIVICPNKSLENLMRITVCVEWGQFACLEEWRVRNDHKPRILVSQYTD